VTPIEVLLIVDAVVGLIVNAPAGLIATVPVPVGLIATAALVGLSVIVELAVRVVNLAVDGEFTPIAPENSVEALKLGTLKLFCVAL
jgi:hypothetical protein